MSGNTTHKLKWGPEEWKKETSGGALQSGNDLGLANVLRCPGKERALEIIISSSLMFVGPLELLTEREKPERKAGWGWGKG